MNSQILTNTSDTLQQDTGETTPYAPSFLDRFMDYVTRLPVPFWLTYGVLFFLQSATIHIVAWLDGWLPAFTFSPLLLLLPLWLWGPLAIMTFLNSSSLEALSSFSLLLDGQSETIRRLKNEFTTMPARSVIISGVLWSVIYLLFNFLAFSSFYEALRVGTFLTAIGFVEGLISFSTGSAIYYHTIRQLNLVHRTLKLVTKFNMFRLDPVYAFSVLTARTGIAWVILVSATLLVFPIELAPVPTLSLMLVQIVLALSAFALPLWTVNRRLVAEKRGLLAENNQYIESTLARLYRHLDEDDLGEMTHLRDAVIALNSEREMLVKIPTWPWRYGLLTGFLSVSVLPIILFLIQLAVQRWLR